MLSRLDAIGVKHVRTSAASTMPNIGGADPHQGRREDTGEHYAYIHDPDGNMIELVYHPLGMEHGEQGLRWTQLPGFVAAEYRDAPSSR